MHFKGFLFLLFIICTYRVSGQDARAKKYFNEAMKSQAKKNYAAARLEMEKAIKEDPAWEEPYTILGNWYFKDHLFQKAAFIYQDAYLKTRKGKDAFALPYARSLVFSGEVNKALAVLNSFHPVKENKERQKLIDQALFIQSAYLKAWKDSLKPLPALNTPDAEMFPGISADENKLYFTRRMNSSDEDFFVSEKDTCGGWLTGKNLGSPPNTPNQEAAQMISADGHYLFYMQCENRSENGWEQGGCDLYMSYTGDSVWSAPQSFGATINTPAFEGMPCLSPDNRELYFVTDRPGGYGGLDIWVSRFENGLWQAPRNLGPSINSAGNETAPFLHIDNKTLYFSSNGRPGLGGADLYISRRTGDSSWSNAINMGYPINSTADESSMSINVGGTRLYLSSDRKGVAGNFDLYETKLPEQLKPVQVGMVKGYVYDSLTGNPLNYASIFIREAGSSENLFHFVSNRGDGSFMITLPKGKRYTWETNRISYLDLIDTMEINRDDSANRYEYNIALLPADYVAPVNDSLILTIHFPKNVAKLSDEDKAVIGRAMAPWIMDHKERNVVYVHGYTDNSGTPLINEQLSLERANLVSKEIQSLGIDELSLHVHGWGEADPIAGNETEEGQDENRRVEIIIRR
jgi:outer membrane protein OmpA-like peptidoglycan-associated protein